MTAYDSNTLSLYCDNTRAVATQQDAKPDEHLWGEFPTFLYGQSSTVCRTRAKKMGWKFLPDGRNLCPRCNSARIRLQKRA